MSARRAYRLAMCVDIAMFGATLVALWLTLFTAW